MILDIEILEEFTEYNEDVKKIKSIAIYKNEISENLFIDLILNYVACKLKNDIIICSSGRIKLMLISLNSICVSIVLFDFKSVEVSLLSTITDSWFFA